VTGRAGLVVLAFAGATGCYGASLDVSQFGATYAMSPTTTNQIAPPPAPLSRSLPPWPSTYEGTKAFAVARFGGPDLYFLFGGGFGIAHSTGGDPVVQQVQDASLAPRRTTLYELAPIIIGPGWRTHGFTFELGFGPSGGTDISVERTVEERDGHGHTLTATQKADELGLFTVQANVCHGIVGLSQDWSLQLCGYVEPETLLGFSYEGFTWAGIAGGVGLRLGYAPDNWPPVEAME